MMLQGWIKPRERFIGIFFILLFAGCSISLISKYDEVIDRGITEFQKKVDLFLIQKQKKTPPSYSDTFYDEAFADLQTLQTRASSVPKNIQTSTIILNIAKQVHQIKTIDSSGAGSPAFFLDAQSTIDQDCQNALTLELAKKRGE